MDFPDETESKMIQLVSRAEKAEARVAELEAMLPSALKAKLESAEARVAELEGRDRRIRDAAFHPRFNSLESLATIRTTLNLAP